MGLQLGTAAMFIPLCTLLLITIVQFSKQPWSPVSKSHQQSHRHQIVASNRCNTMLQELARSGLASMADVIPGDVHKRFSIAQRKYVNMREELTSWHTKHKLTKRIAEMTDSQQTAFIGLALIPCIRTVCGIGLNEGSIAAFMAAREDLQFRVLRSDTQLSLSYYSKKHPKRVTSSGSRSTVLLQEGPICDMVVINGGNDFNTTYEHIALMQTVANPSFNILVIEDTFCVSDLCSGSQKAMDQAKAVGLIDVLYTETADASGRLLPGSMNLSRFAEHGFSFGRYQLSTKGLT